MYTFPEVQRLIKPYEKLFKFLSIKTGTNITNTVDVFFLDNLFQTLVSNFLILNGDNVAVLHIFFNFGRLFF